MDEITNNMHKNIIEIAENRLEKKLSYDITNKINNYGSYMGMEMIIDTVSTIEIEGLENYLENL